MIVEVSQTGALELYWRHPVSTNPARSSAEAFVSQFRRHAGAVRAIRDIVSTKRFPANTNGDMAALELLASQIALGGVVVLDHRSEIRFGGVRLPVISLTHSIALLLLSRTQENRNLAKARGWFESVGSDELELAWKGLWMRYGRADGLPSRYEIVEQAEKALESGELIAVFHPLPIAAEAVVNDPAPAPAGAPVRSGPVDPPEGNTFDSEHAAGTQAGVLIEASRTGVPFCEVCARNAQRNAA